MPRLHPPRSASATSRPRRAWWRYAVLGTLAVALGATASTAQGWESEIVYEGSDGALVYVSDAEGNRVPDFSRAGYGGGVPLPSVSTLVTVEPGDGDDTSRIQNALDFVGGWTPDADGFRGAVELTAGEYQINGTLHLRRDGVVLRGAGDGEDPATNTVLRRSGTSQSPVVALGGSILTGGDAIIRRDASRDTSHVIDAVVPIGSASVRMGRPELYAAGDEIVVFHPATSAWLAAVDGGGTADDPPWESDEVPIAYARTVERVEGDRLVLDAPVFARLDRALSQSYVYHRDRSNYVERVGLEDLRIDIETAGPTSETHSENAVLLVLVENAWVSGVTALHFWHAGVSVQNSRYVTVTGCEALEPHSLVEGSRRYNFEAQRSQLVLFQGNRATQARHAYVGNGTTLDSGIVFLDNVSEDAFTSSESHRRWGTGFLYDNHTELGASGSGGSARRIHLGNRGDFGTGHGWACANCVMWNGAMNGGIAVIEKPPTAQNYAIGVQGTVTNDGPFLSTTASWIEGTDRSGLSPRSLYQRQVEDRLRATDRAADLPSVSAPRLFPSQPNPARDTMVLRYQVATSGTVRVRLLDLLGREVARLGDGERAPGSYTMTVNVGEIAPGVYLVHLSTAGGSAVQRVSVVR